VSSGTHDAGDAEPLADYLAWEPRAWPRDPVARQRFAAFLQELRAELTAAEPVLPDFDGTDLDLRGARLPRAPLDGARLHGATLDDVDLRHAWLNEAELPGASLHRTDLTSASLRAADLSHADARGAFLDHCDLYELQAFRTDLRDARLRSATLTYALLAEADLRGADLRDATIGEWVNLEGAHLAGARVEGLAGEVYGPIDVGGPTPLDGAALEAWFRDQGAPNLKARLRSPTPDH
jgi:uncharacterized protein YjbI with pentapeptide repeats